MKLLHFITATAILSISGLTATAQNSLPAPGTPDNGGNGFLGGNSLMAPGQQQFPGGLGNQWNNRWPGMGNYTPPPFAANPNWQNSGNITVIATGYDIYGQVKQIPMTVNYWYNGLRYIVMVISAYNPITEMWNYQLNVPAINTSYYFQNNTYNFYAALPTGTFYFNL